MNLLWTIIMLASITAMIFINPDGAVNAMTKGANNAVSLSFSLLATYSLWLGLSTLIERTGMGNFLARLLKKPISFLFPGASPQAAKFLTMNVSANFLGLGNAATPMGINAALALDDGAENATPDMIMLLVLSSASLQIIPSTVIGMRAAAGASPVSFLPACIAASLLSTTLGVSIVKLITRLERKRSSRAKIRRSARQERRGHSA